MKTDKYIIQTKETQYRQIMSETKILDIQLLEFNKGQIEGLPKNPRMIRKQAPQIKWVISFADGTQCGDGTIYRASNFVLTGIKKKHTNNRIRKWLTNSKKTLDNKNFPSINGRYFSNVLLEQGGGHYVNGFQLRYIYFLDKKSRQNLTVPELPFSKIDEIGAGMYKGENISRNERHTECEAQKERKKTKLNNERETL